MKRILILLSGVICFPVFGDSLQEYGISVKSTQASGKSSIAHLNTLCGADIPYSFKVNGEGKELLCSETSFANGEDLGEVKTRTTINLFVTKSDEFTFDFQSSECGSFKMKRSWSGEPFTFKGQSLKGCDLIGQVTKN